MPIRKKLVNIPGRASNSRTSRVPWAAVHVDGGEDNGGGNGVGYSWLQNEDEVEITISMKGRAVGGECE